ncbi:MAG TPA: hypothetical protein VGB38_01465 [bacterium]
MKAGLIVVIGMSVMYIFSTVGMAFAWTKYRRRQHGFPSRAKSGRTK